MAVWPHPAWLLVTLAAQILAHKFMLTLLDCQNSPGLKRIAGACSTTQDFTDLVNEAARRLMRRGDRFDTAIPIFVCVNNGCLVMPRYVQQIRRINFCNHEIKVRNGS